jgi:DNA-binding transcriptional regulator YhcF (GntR family)
MVRPTRARYVADQLREQLETGRLSAAPTACQLAKRFGVAERTALKALHILRGEGILVFSQGKRVRVAPGHSGEALDDSAGTRLFRRLKSSIVKGTYRTGHTLPKLDYFVIGQHVSRTTVSKAFKMLEQEGLIRKQGRRWIVGSSPRRSSGAAALRSKDTPVVVMVVPAHNVWADMLDEHLRPFASEFFAELSRHRFSHVLCQRSDPNPFRRAFATGKDETLSLVRALGRRYAGTLIVGQPDRFPDIKTWVKALARCERPVLWFDYDNSAPAFDRRTVGFDKFYRCFCDESKCVSLALDRLSRFGHTTVAVPICRALARDYWFSRRVELIRDTGSRLHSPVDIISVRQDEPVWEQIRKLEGHNVTFERINEMFVDQKRAHPRTSDAAVRRMLAGALLHEFPSLASILAMKEVTAIFAPNQSLAVNYAVWFDATGAKLPRDISLIGIDNYLRAAIFPVSIVSQNFEGLAYSMSRVFIGDVPANADKWGNMPNEPEFIDRGSLGRPRSRAIRVGLGVA